MINSPRKTPIKESYNKRFISIDSFKGFIILIMVFVNSLSLYDNIPSWTKHAPDYGLTYVDFIAPFFIFIMALNFKLSFNKRIQTSTPFSVYIHFLKRYLIIFAIGIILTLRLEPNIFEIRWGILQVLAIAGLMLLLLIKIKTYIRLLISITFLIIHQYFLTSSLGEVIFNSIEGGFFSSLSWGGMIILSSVICDQFQKSNMSYFFIGGGILLIIIGLITSNIWGFSRFRITLPFVLLTVGTSSIFFYIFYYIIEVKLSDSHLSQKENFLSISGKNSFLLFIIHLFVINIVYFFLPSNSLANLVFIYGYIHVVLIWVFSYLIFKAEIVIII
ncbi:MAG: DUF1624 domain-containing protein [Candidatus Lokiarchaeota archaeon]|nr:DUF1624 domain-containing protein [Candidatus Lokiarchaeota archaeon]MBD3202007.1 DUF1624 domain-containing protein [Candidatus Lokiarchaeota archaeon]